MDRRALPADDREAAREQAAADHKAALEEQAAAREAAPEEFVDAGYDDTLPGQVEVVAGSVQHTQLLNSYRNATSYGPDHNVVVPEEEPPPDPPPEEDAQAREHPLTPEEEEEEAERQRIADEEGRA
jgi:hypothetical protein